MGTALAFEVGGKVDRVCAVVVTYNRKALLQECLQALFSQTHALSDIIVVDNASTDSTAALFQDSASAQPTHLRYTRLETNSGGAGGFHRGVELAIATDCSWLWLLDDDTILRENALEELLQAWRRFPPNKKPEMLASKVEWLDGALHQMNFPSLKRPASNPETVVLAVQNATLPIRAASFVSVLIHRSAVARHGLPCADYFIWNDDTEYTARILRDGFGVLVPASVATHKTPQNYSAFSASPQRSYYQVRNVLWMILRSSAWRIDERLKIAVIHLKWLMSYLWRANFSAEACRYIFAGLRDGLFKAPRN